jgi:hypothetical protein
MVGITDMLKKEMHVTSAVTDARYKIIKMYELLIKLRHVLTMVGIEGSDFL